MKLVKVFYDFLSVFGIVVVGDSVTVYLKGSPVMTAYQGADEVADGMVTKIGRHITNSNFAITR